MDAGHVPGVQAADGGPSRDARSEPSDLPTVAAADDASIVGPMEAAAPDVDAGADVDAGREPLAQLDALWLRDAPAACGDDAACEPGTACLFPSPGAAGLCATACLTHEECSAQQQCFPGFAGGDGACFELAAEGEACGIPFRRLCATGLTCFPLGEESLAGACFRPCAPESGAQQCGGDACIGGWTNGLGETLGVCGRLIERGGRCDEPLAGHALCGDGDVCAPGDGPGSQPDTAWTCRQRCDVGMPCADGQCLAFALLGSREQRACY